MECGVTPLAGFSCSPLSALGLIAYGLAAVSIVALVAYLSRGRRKQLARNLSLAVAVLAVIPFVYSTFANLRTADVIERAYQEFEALCFTKAYERQNPSVAGMSALAVTPPAGPAGVGGFDLFYGAGRPKEWANKPVLADTNKRDLGTLELRFEYLPEQREIAGRRIVFHGVRQAIIDANTGRLLAERINYFWGNDLNRGAICLGADWFRDNWAFVERVLGPAKTGLAIADSNGHKQQQYVKAVLISSEEGSFIVGNQTQKDVLPANSVYDFEGRMIKTPTAVFPILDYRNNEPMPIIATVERDTDLVLVMLPQGWQRDRPVRQILFHFRTKNGAEIRNVIAQVPPGVDWSRGWGFDPCDVQISNRRIQFKLLGSKIDGVEGPERVQNGGTYGKRHAFEVMLPEDEAARNGRGPLFESPFVKSRCVDPAIETASRWRR